VKEELASSSSVAKVCLLKTSVIGFCALGASFTYEADAKDL
jgi:hypothetical protein